MRLDYLDLAEPSIANSHPEIVARIRADSMSLPLLLINGKLRISGHFDIHLLQSVIQAEIEMENE